MTWTQGWRPKQPTLIRLACRFVADDARLGDFFHPDRLVLEVKMDWIQGVAPRTATIIEDYNSPPLLASVYKSGGLFNPL